MKTTRNIVKVVLENVWIETAAVETPQVCTVVMQVPGEHIRGECKKRGLQPADFHLEGADDAELSVLTGADFYWQVVTGKVERLTESRVALESAFGWAIQGPVQMSSMTDITRIHISLDEDTPISKQLHAFWEVEY